MGAKVRKKEVRNMEVICQLADGSPLNQGEPSPKDDPPSIGKKLIKP